MASSPRMHSSPRFPRSPARSRPSSGDFTLTDVTRKHSGGSITGVEKKMDAEVDRMFQHWDRNIPSTACDILSIKPMRNSTSGHRLHSSLSPYSLFPDPGALKKAVSIERLHDGKHDTNSLSGDERDNSSSESVEEDSSRRPLYVTCPQSGKRMVRLQFDVQGFSSRDIKVKMNGRKLIIFAVHREADSGRRSTTEFCRKIKLPEDVDIDRLSCNYADGILTAEGPVIPRPETSRHSSLKEKMKEHHQTVKLEQLNTPLIRHTDMGRMMQMFVELGKIFRPDDVVVKLKGHDKLVITATRQEENAKDTLNATVTREFQLPERIYPHSLKAGLTHDGILNVTALIHQPSPVNGENPSPGKTSVSSSSSEAASTPSKQPHCASDTPSSSRANSLSVPGEEGKLHESQHLTTAEITTTNTTTAAAPPSTTTISSSTNATTTTPHTTSPAALTIAPTTTTSTHVTPAPTSTTKSSVSKQKSDDKGPT